MLYLSYISMIVTEAMLFMYSITLAFGINTVSIFLCVFNAIVRNDFTIGGDIDDKYVPSQAKL